MLIWLDPDKNIVYIKFQIEKTEIESSKKLNSSLLLNILKNKGWNFSNSTITCTKEYVTQNELIGILKDIDVPSDGIEQILEESSMQT